MCNRHELPPIIGHDDDISGVIVSLRNRSNKRPGEVLDTTDPLPLHDFGPFTSFFTAVALSLAAVGIVLGIMSLIEWIRLDLYLLPLVDLWQK